MNRRTRLALPHLSHTLDSGPGGCVQISYAGEWEASMTCVMVLAKCLLWLEAHEAHLRTGKDITAFTA